MAVDLHDPALFTLSSQDHHFEALQSNNSNKRYLFASSESGSELSSPTGSDHLNSTITESSEEEEDCLIAELTRQMAQFMLRDEDKHEKSYGSPMVEKNEETAAYGHGFQSKQALIDEQIRAIKQLKQEQPMKQKEQKPKTKHHQSKGKVLGGFNNGYHSNTLWYTLHQQQLHQQQSKKQTGSDLRAVFFTGSVSKNGSSGTGVFLPRATGGTSCNSRKKQGCATVLIPARVVQALKLHFEKTRVPSRFNTTDFNNGSDIMNSPQKGRSGATVPRTSHHEEVSLPQEWTY
ncbi:hypothetical protein F3Y22_tig00110419pilonHSYRG00141 [Hibiscus syriacus]|uniref:Uncharacterized protein n=1 Tax=Hibiscus syriacus TaxID=106335 RepID=A0A6A3ARY0_HIBSY|nr:hypothetical protein F3Y22_tig00110419pilonHSYRG00141 [Hibiscus syriacus]